MKTKNILRTLLIAVTMLLGANNAQAAETQLWPTSGTENKWTGDWAKNNDGENINIPASAFTNLVNGNMLRIYVTQGALNESYYQFKLCDSSWQEINFQEGNKVDSYIEIEINDNLISRLSGGAIIQGYNLYINKITQNEVTLEVGENTILENAGWCNNWGEGKSVPSLKLKKAKAGDKVRIYGNFNSGWATEFLNINSNGNWEKFTIAEWGDNSQANAGTTTVKNNSNGNYIEFTLTDGNLTTIRSGKGCMIQGVQFEVRKVVIYVESNTPTPSPTTHTVYFYTDDAKTDLWHSETFAEGAEIKMPPSDPTRSGYIFGGWNGLPKYMGTSDISVSAIWVEEVKNFNVYTSYDSNYGSVTLSSSYPEKGSTVYVTTTPAAGFYVSSIYLSTSDQISGGNNSYSFTMPGQDVTVYVEFAAGAVTASITSSTKLATFCSEYALDFSSVTGLKAYIVTGENEGYAVLSKVTGTVAAGTGLIIYGETTDIPVAISGSTPQGNLLVGVLSDTSVSGAGKYVLTEKNGAVVFGETSAATATVPAGHAYLNLGASARTRQIIIKVGNDATGISDIETESGQQVIYNLRGQRVEKPTRGGIYIINGKKVLMK